MAWAKTQGVTIILDFEEGALHIPDLWRDIQNPTTKGQGRVVLNKVMEFADRERLLVEIEYLTNETWLGTYYQSFGFRAYGEAGEITNLRRPVCRTSERVA